MQPDEIARRRPVWMALSELWLDTELDEGDWERLAAVLASSPYDVHQLRAIHDAEVAPAVGDNLFSVAGVWDGFDEDWLVSRCVEVADRRQGWLRRWREAWEAPVRRLLNGKVLDHLLARVERRRSAQRQASQ